MWALLGLIALVGAHRRAGAGRVIETWKRVLVLAPHTDDGEFGCGGTMARLVEAGVEVHYHAFSIATRSLPPGFAPDTLAREVREATGELGIPEAQLRVHDFDVRTFPERRQDILELLVGLWEELQPGRRLPAVPPRRAPGPPDDRAGRPARVQADDGARLRDPLEQLRLLLRRLRRARAAAPGEEGGGARAATPRSSTAATRTPSTSGTSPACTGSTSTASTRSASRSTGSSPSRAAAARCDGVGVSGLRRISDHVYWLPPAKPDRPSLCAVVGEHATLMLDAGASDAHARLFLDALAAEGVAPPIAVVLTHSDWDHVFGAVEVGAPVIAHRLTDIALAELAATDWSDEALDARVEAGERSPQHAANIKEELPAPRNVRVARADSLVEDGLDLELGGATVQVRHVGGDHAADSTVIYVKQDRLLFLGDALYESTGGEARRSSAHVDRRARVPAARRGQRLRRRALRRGAHRHGDASRGGRRAPRSRSAGRASSSASPWRTGARSTRRPRSRPRARTSAPSRASCKRISSAPAIDGHAAQTVSQGASIRPGRVRLLRAARSGRCRRRRGRRRRRAGRWRSSPRSPGRARRSRKYVSIPYSIPTGRPRRASSRARPQITVPDRAARVGVARAPDAVRLLEARAEPLAAPDLAEHRQGGDLVAEDDVVAAEDVERIDRLRPAA